MATDAQSLVTQGACYQCAGQLSMFQLMELALLAQISLNQSASNATDPQSLLAQGACYECFGLSMYEIMKLVLLKQISGG